MAFKIAVSGLKAATADLDVTGNNIANSNTVGFKESRAQFADVYAVSNLGSSQDAIGQGVQLSAVAQQFAQGNISFTENNMDLAINGEGFFVLESNGSRAYTRAGQFGVDKNGFVVNSTGQNLIAFGANNGSITGAVQPLQLATSILPPSETANVSVQVNLDSDETVPAVPFDPDERELVQQRHLAHGVRLARRRAPGDGLLPQDRQQRLGEPHAGGRRRGADPRGPRT